MSALEWVANTPQGGLTACIALIVVVALVVVQCAAMWCVRDTTWDRYSHAGDHTVGRWAWVRWRKTVHAMVLVNARSRLQRELADTPRARAARDRAVRHGMQVAPYVRHAKHDYSHGH